MDKSSLWNQTHIKLATHHTYSYSLSDALTDWSVLKKKQESTNDLKPKWQTQDFIASKTFNI